MKPDKIAPLFMAFWGFLFVIFFLMFHVNKDVTFKRKYFPFAMVFAGVVFAGFITATMPAYRILIIGYPTIVLICYLNIRMTKFCAKCGATNINRMIFTAMNYCQKCGEPFEKNDKPANQAL